MTAPGKTAKFIRRGFKMNKIYKKLKEACPERVKGVADPERSRRGFTLVEMLIATSILVVILAAAVNVEVSNTKLANYNKHRIQAINLAQQQINLVKTIRDNSQQANPDDPFAGLTVDPDNLDQLWELKSNGDSTWKLDPVSGDYTKEIDGVTYKIKLKIKDAGALE